MLSNINKVQNNATRLGIGNVFVSPRKNKKYAIMVNGKWVHFGDSRYEDFTGHGDLKRRELFRKRNAKWATANKDTPAWLSYNLLW
jgi:phage pi2 protein 07